MNLKEKEVFYRRHYENFLKSNQNKTAYCREHLVSLSAFKNWFYKFELQKNTRVDSASGSSRIQRVNQPVFDFVEVRGLSQGGSNLYKVSIGKVNIELCHLPQPQWIYDLTKLLGEKG